ncbi:cytochrome P450 [Sphingobium sp. OAS761]|uniref:cytochrome P450 n=1 Tax=Sphingobium sp. OAS761 TaxID=2817901 RepID=UPI00209E5500|nr:cytochrome P450 [Sphingobium sp. OAS761]MCP1472388.1 cytochrome P450 [Sphingobium sp. OAS761]
MATITREKVTKNFPLWGALPANIEPYSLIEQLRDGDEVFYAPNSHATGAGTWIFTRFRQIKKLYSLTRQLSVQNQTGVGALLGEAMRMVPSEADPPEHSGYRGVLSPFFLNGPLDILQPSIRALSDELVQTLLPRGECEFMSDYARRFPVGVFLRLMGLPVGDIDLLNGLATTITYHPDPAEKGRALGEIKHYLEEQIRIAEVTPREDIISHIATAQIAGRPINDEEKFALSFNVFVGGMDTVSASLGWHFRYLAMNEDLQGRMRADRSLIPAVIEELLRVYSIVSSTRTALEDFEIDGVRIQKGDMITLGTELANRDPDAFDNPAAVDIHRDNKRHLSFGYGLHHCLGAPLARRELRIAMESWFDAVPAIRLAGDVNDGMPTWAGNIFSLEKLRLTW